MKVQDEQDVLSPQLQFERITVFSTAGCKFCRRAKELLRSRGIKHFGDVDLSVFPERRDEMVTLSNGRTTVPQLFLNGKHVGGFDDIDKLLQNNTLDDEIMAALLAPERSDKHPLAPEPAADADDAAGTADEEGAARQLNPFEPLIQRLRDPDNGLKIGTHMHRFFRRYKRSFKGAEILAWIRQNERDTGGQTLSVGAAEQLVQNLINCNRLCDVTNHCAVRDFNSSTLYRFREDHDTWALNTGILWRGDARNATTVARDLRAKLLDLHEEFIVDDGKAVDYQRLRLSDKFRAFAEATAELQAVDVSSLSREERLGMFINLYNALVVHAIAVKGPPSGAMGRLKFFTHAAYDVGGHRLSLVKIEDGILRGNVRHMYKPWGGPAFGPDDPRRALAIQPVDPRIHFALNCGAKSCPPIKVFDVGNLEDGLRWAAEAFLDDETNLHVDAEERTVTLSMILKWYRTDFVSEDASDEQFLQTVASLAPSAQRARIEDLLRSPEPLVLRYNKYDWTINAV